MRRWCLLYRYPAHAVSARASRSTRRRPRHPARLCANELIDTRQAPAISEYLRTGNVRIRIEARCRGERCKTSDATAVQPSASSSELQADIERLTAEIENLTAEKKKIERDAKDGKNRILSWLGTGGTAENWRRKLPTRTDRLPHYKSNSPICRNGTMI